MLEFGPRGGSDGEASVVPAARRAVVFDDNAAICMLAVARLKQLGFDAESVVEKAEFFAILESFRPELILLDLSLGDTDAINLFGFLREQNFGGHIILMSGHTATMLDHARRLGEEAGLAVAGVLEKPFRQSDIRAIIDNLDVTVTAPRVPHSDRSNPGLLRDALRNGGLEFWYQPKVALQHQLYCWCRKPRQNPASATGHSDARRLLAASVGSGLE